MSHPMLVDAFAHHVWATIRVLDACGALNLYASGRFVPILSALGYDWYIPVAAEREAQQYRSQREAAEHAAEEYGPSGSGF